MLQCDICYYKSSNFGHGLGLGWIHDDLQRNHNDVHGSRINHGWYFLLVLFVLPDVASRCCHFGKA